MHVKTEKVLFVVKTLTKKKKKENRAAAKLISSHGSEN